MLNTEDLFPNIEYKAANEAVTANSVVVPLSDIPGITAALAAGVGSDGRALMYALIEAAVNGTAAVIAAEGAAAVSGFTITQGASGVVAGQTNQTTRNFACTVTINAPDEVGGAVTLLPNT